KHTFQYIMLPFLNPEIFPDNLLPLLAKHFKNPKASSDTDSELALALKQYDAPNNKTFIFEVPLGKTFTLYNGRKFTMGKKRVKRFECVEVSSGKLYLFNPNAEVELVNSTMNKNYYAILMAGGVGSRFWPVSTQQFPKQFHDMLGTEEILLQKTYHRLASF